MKLKWRQTNWRIEKARLERNRRILWVVFFIALALNIIVGLWPK